MKTTYSIRWWKLQNSRCFAYPTFRKVKRWCVYLPLSLNVESLYRNGTPYLYAFLTSYSRNITQTREIIYSYFPMSSYEFRKENNCLHVTPTPVMLQQSPLIPSVSMMVCFFTSTLYIGHIYVSWACTYESACMVYSLSECNKDGSKKYFQAIWSTRRLVWWDFSWIYWMWSIFDEDLLYDARCDYVKEIRARNLSFIKQFHLVLGRWNYTSLPL